MIAMSKSKLRKNAKRLNSYMDFRAKKEFPNCNGSAHEFNTNFYYDCFKKGMRTFFGIECSSDGSIIKDNQNPVAYKEFVEYEKSLDKEYFKVSPDKTCSVPLIQTIELLGLGKHDLPVIRTSASGLYETYKWLEDEKQKGLFGYNHHIENTKDHLKEDYPEIKIKLHKEFKPKHSGYNPSHKSEEVSQFINSALILEINHFMDVCPGPMFSERTLH
jgi:hypothetical protein